MSKAFVAGLVGIALLVVAGVAGISQRDAKKDTEKREYQAELVDATQVERGVLSEKQRVHSTLYSYAAVTHISISSLVEKFQNEGKLFEAEIAPPLVMLTDETARPEDYFGDLASESNAVIQGKVTGKVLLDGVIAKASDHMFAPLPTNKQVVLYLQFIPETGAYKSTSPTGSFELNGNTLTSLTCKHNK